MNRQPFARLSVALATIAVAGLGAMSLSGHSTPDRNAAPAPQPADPTTPGTAALRAFLNPETGQVEIGTRTTSEELDPDSQNALRRDTEGLTQVRHADGSVSMDLQGRFQSVAMAQVGRDGRVVVCTDDSDKARRVIEGNVTVTSTPEVE